MLFSTPEGTPHIDALEIAAAAPGTITNYWLRLVTGPLGMPISIPIIVARGRESGKVLGVTAAVHGNELNGISLIQRLFRKIDVERLSGSIVGIPVVNVPSLHRKKRRFIDGTDLNHIMPGKADGNVSQVYAWRFVERIVKQLDYLIDLHTASNGRINSYYIRADMSNETVRQMALLQNPQIIVHNPPNDGTLRGTAAQLGIPAITMEVGNPNVYQRGIISDGLSGLMNVLDFLGLHDSPRTEVKEKIVNCHHSYWIYTDTGGFMTVHPNVTDFVTKGELIATMRNVFGDVVKEYLAPEDGVVIGKSVNPMNQTGGRVLHLGIV